MGADSVTTPVTGFTIEVSSALSSFMVSVELTHFQTIFAAAEGKKNAKTMPLHKNSFNINWSELKLQISIINKLHL